MQAYNLCYSTLISKTDAERQFPGGSGTASCRRRSAWTGSITCYCPDEAKCILPRIWEDSSAARKRAKADMKKATDPMEKAFQNGRRPFCFVEVANYTDTPSTRVATPGRRRRAVDSTPRPTRRSRTAGSW